MRKICSFAAVAAGLALLISQPLAGTAATLPKVALPTVSTPAAKLPVVTTPQVTVPSVTVPSVTVPSVTTPHVTTPVGPAPTVSTPSVTTPTATTPKISAPVVKTPSVTTPSSTPSVTVPTPSVTAPTPSVSLPSGTSRLVKTPNLAGSPSSASSSSSSPSGSPAGPAGSSGDSPATTSSSSPAAQRNAGTTAAAASPHSKHSASSPASFVTERRSYRAQEASRHSRGSQQLAENRRLRTIVDRYQGCISSLDSRSQRLLSLRAGLHGAPRSAGSVARILHVSTGREQLLERMSLLALQTSGRGGCGGSSAVATVPISGPAQLTSAAPWVAPASATPVSTASGSSSSGSPGSPSAQHVRAAGGRSAAPVVITPAATRTVEQASAGQDAVAWPEIVLLGMLVLAASLVLLPAVRRRLLPTLAGLPPVDGHADRAGVASVVAAAALADGSASATETSAPAETTPAAKTSAPAETTPAAETSVPAATPAAADLAPAAGAPESLEPSEPVAGVESPRSAANLAPEPQAEPQSLRGNPEPAVQGQTRPAWVREHATQGALVATVLAGGLVRILKRGRGR